MTSSLRTVSTLGLETCSRGKARHLLHKLLGLTVCRLDQVVRRGPLRANLLLVPQCTIEFGFGLVNKLNCLFASKPREFTEDFFGSRFQMLQMKMKINEYEIFSYNHFL